MLLAFINEFYYRLNQLYHDLSLVLSERTVTILSFIGTFILSIQLIFNNMSFLWLFTEGIPLLGAMQGFLWEGTFSVGLLLMFLPIFREKVEHYHNLPQQINKKLILPLIGYILFWGISLFTAGFGRVKFVIIVALIVVPIYMQSRQFKNYDKLFNRYLYMNVVLAAIYYVLSFFWMPYVGARYPALSFNPNVIGALALFFATCAVILKYRNANRTLNLFLYMIIGVSFGFVLLAETRTIIITFVALTIASVMLSFREWSKEKLLRRCGELIVILFISLGTISAIEMKNEGVTYFNEFAPPHNPYFETVRTLNRRKLPLFYESVVTQEDAKNRNFLGRFEEEQESTDRVLSGRLKIWQDYLGRLKLLGQRELDRDYKRKHKIPIHAHNIWIQMAYDGGIICGAFFLIYTVMRFVEGFKIFLRGNITYFEFAFIVSSVSFVVRGIVEASYSPMYYNIALLHLLTLIPMIYNKTNTKKLTRLMH
ncbi:O-antigen ligase family protein [Allofustis seminis]|uniref:O-antigen ligase family protein n=1 Tax=Allofustis seminis TaxID=166939 RepID=UPI0003657C31|nr:O-antigen ligase family protein [Allofustis seminis]